LNIANRPIPFSPWITRPPTVFVSPLRFFSALMFVAGFSQCSRTTFADMPVPLSVTPMKEPGIVSRLGPKPSNLISTFVASAS